MSKIKHPTTHEELQQFKVDHNISDVVGEDFWSLYVALDALLINDPIYGDKRWEEIEKAKRKITRFIYEGSLTHVSGYQSKLAKDILCDPLLSSKQKKNKTTDEHAIPPQVYAHFICWAWKILFHERLDNLVLHVLTVSQTIKTTVEENLYLKSFTVNNNDTGNVLMVKCQWDQRYNKAGIDKLWNKNEGRYTFDFPLMPAGGKDFTKFEEENLLIK